MDDFEYISFDVDLCQFVDEALDPDTIKGLLKINEQAKYSKLVHFICMDTEVKTI